MSPLIGCPENPPLHTPQSSITAVPSHTPAQSTRYFPRPPRGYLRRAADQPGRRGNRGDRGALAEAQTVQEFDRTAGFGAVQSLTKTGVSPGIPVPRDSPTRRNRTACRRRPHTPSRFPRVHICRRGRRPRRLRRCRTGKPGKRRSGGRWGFWFPRFANFRSKSKKTCRLLEFQKSNAIRSWKVSFCVSKTGFQHVRKLPVWLRLKSGGFLESTRRRSTLRFLRNNSETAARRCLRRPERRRRLGGKPLLRRTFHGTTLQTDGPRENAEFGRHQTHGDGERVRVIVDPRGLLVNNSLQHRVQKVQIHVIPVDDHSPTSNRGNSDTSCCKRREGRDCGRCSCPA